MSHQTPIRNPFMLMTHPEVVIAAMENSTRLSQLNRHLCRPLDRHSLPEAGQRTTESDAGDDGVETDD